VGYKKSSKNKIEPTRNEQKPNDSPLSRSSSCQRIYKRFIQIPNNMQNSKNSPTRLSPFRKTENKIMFFAIKWASIEEKPLIRKTQVERAENVSSGRSWSTHISLSVHNKRLRKRAAEIREIGRKERALAIDNRAERGREWRPFIAMRAPFRREPSLLKLLVWFIEVGWCSVNHSGGNMFKGLVRGYSPQSTAPNFAVMSLGDIEEGSKKKWQHTR